MVVLALLFSGCAAAGAKRAPEAAAPSDAAPTPQPEKKLEYERILGTFVAQPELIIYLSPAVCLKFCDSDRPLGTYEGLIRQAEQLGATRVVAAAKLSLGARLWSRGDPDEAYRRIREAQTLFARSSDVEGLAHTYEWLGYLFYESGAANDAADQLAVAYQLFGKLGNGAAQARVLGYAE